MIFSSESKKANELRSKPTLGAEARPLLYALQQSLGRVKEFHWPSWLAPVDDPFATSGGRAHPEYTTKRSR